MTVLMTVCINTFLVKLLACFCKTVSRLRRVEGTNWLNEKGAPSFSCLQDHLPVKQLARTSESIRYKRVEFWSDFNHEVFKNIFLRSKIASKIGNKSEKFERFSSVPWVIVRKLTVHVSSWISLLQSWCDQPGESLQWLISLVVSHKIILFIGRWCHWRHNHAHTKKHQHKQLMHTFTDRTHANTPVSKYLHSQSHNQQFAAVRVEKTDR